MRRQNKIESSFTVAPLFLLFALSTPYPAKAFGERRKRKKDKNKTDPRREIDSNANILLVPRPTDTFDFSFPHSEKVRERRRVIFLDASFEVRQDAFPSPRRGKRWRRWTVARE